HYSSETVRPPASPLFPYTTLFRSERRPPLGERHGGHVAAGGEQLVGDEQQQRVRAGEDEAATRQQLLALDERLHPARRHHARKRSEEHTSELQSLRHLVCRLLLEK